MSLERLYYNDPFSNIVISCDFSDSIDEAALVQRLQTALHNFPAFSQAIGIDDNSNLAYRTVGFAHNQIVASEEEETALIGRLMAHPFDLADGESIRIVYRAMPFGYRLYFCMHHIVGDANSLVLLLRSALTQEKITLSDAQCAQEDVKIDAQAQYLVRTINKQYPHQDYSREDYLRMHENIFSQAHLDIRKIIVEKDELNSLKNLCKEQGISLTAYIVAELLHRQTVAMVCLPADTRKNGDAFGNFVGRIDIAKNRENAVSAIHQTIRDALQDDQGHSEQLLAMIHPQFYDDVIFDVYGNVPNLTARKMAKLIGYKDLKAKTFVSNLKQVPLQSELVSNLCFYPPHPFERHSTLGIVTHGNQMVITVQKFRKENRNE